MIVQSYELNMIPGGMPLRIPVSQYDADSRTLEFTLVGGSTAFSAPSAATATIDGTKPDGRSFSYTAIITGSKAMVPIADQMTAVAGTVDCQLTVRYGPEVLGSANFVLIVERAALPEDADLSESDWSALENALSESAAAAAETKASAAAAAGSASNAASSASAAANSAKSAASAAANAVSSKADKKVPAAAGNIATLNASGNLADSGKQPTPAGIGAAPGGFGWGETSGIDAPGNNPDNVTKTCVFSCASAADNSLNGCPAVGIWNGRYQSHTSGNHGWMVMVCRPTGVVSGGSIVTRQKLSGVWQPWEWLNPPMVAGTEYRLTERFRGKPVYCRVVDCGALPNKAQKTVSHGGNGGWYVLRYFGYSPTGTAGWSQAVPYGANTQLRITDKYIYVVTTEDYSAKTLLVALYYTKEE